MMTSLMMTSHVMHSNHVNNSVNNGCYGGTTIMMTSSMTSRIATMLLHCHSKHPKNTYKTPENPRQKTQKMPKNHEKTLDIGLKPRKCLENPRKPWVRHTRDVISDVILNIATGGRDLALALPSYEY